MQVHHYQGQFKNGQNGAGMCVYNNIITILDVINYNYFLSLLLLMERLATQVN